jgi:ankyrin repeat protein
LDLQTAAHEGNAEEVRLHIAHGSNLNEKNVDGSTPLITAATFGHAEAVEALVEGGADLNLANNDGSTALISAAFLCRTEVVQVLLDSGVDTNVRNNAGSTALDSVAGPFEEVNFIYEIVESALGPLGLMLDYEHIKATRPTIAAMLR